MLTTRIGCLSEVILNIQFEIKSDLNGILKFCSLLVWMNSFDFNSVNLDCRLGYSMRRLWQHLLLHH